MVLCGIIKELKIFLWSLLFIVPGIIKAYEYHMVEFALAENPEMSIKDAFHASRTLTDGHKLDLFVMELSYIGWSFVDALTAGILSVVWLNSYRYAALAEAYAALRENAIKANLLDETYFTAGFGHSPDAYINR